MIRKLAESRVAIIAKKLQEQQGGQGDTSKSANASDVEEENQNLRQTIQNLMEANTKLVNSTKEKLGFFEKELSRYKQKAAGIPRYFSSFFGALWV